MDRRAPSASASASASAATTARRIRRENPWERPAAAAAGGEAGGLVKRKAKAKAKAKKRKRPPPISTTLRELVRAIKGQDEQMRLWEMRIRGSLTQMAGVIAEQQNVPELLQAIAVQRGQLAALRTRLAVRRKEYVPEVAPEASCLEAAAALVEQSATKHAAGAAAISAIMDQVTEHTERVDALLGMKLPGVDN